MTIYHFKKGEKKMNDKIKELVKLSEENPEMEIITMVNQEVVAGDDFAYWMGRIEKIEKGIYQHADERVYLDKDEIKDRIRYNAESEPEFENLSNDDFEKVIDKEFDRLKDAGEIKEAIIIYIGVDND